MKNYNNTTNTLFMKTSQNEINFFLYIFKLNLHFNVFDGIHENINL